MRLSSYDDVDNALLEIGKVESVLAKKEADMNAKIQAVKEKYDNETIEQRTFCDNLKERIEAFCNANKGDFAKQRTMNLTHGTVGFRNNPPKVVQLNKKFTVKTSIELLKKIFGGKYVRAKEEVNKDLILSEYATQVLKDEQLAATGLRIDNDETFNIEINWESIQN
jgi:phage host-nuclease inhibitor protein Gam